jgi:two-component system phosphate regulon response regulator PhoB
MHALIIEDQPLIATIIEAVLADCGFATFDVAASSSDAVRAAARRCPDLITADVGLAEGNGIEAIRDICPDLSIPVIFITGRAPAQVRAEISDFPVLHKPFSVQTLTYAVAASMRQRAD